MIGIEAIGAITAAGDDAPNTMASIVSELHLFDAIDVLDSDGEHLTGARTGLSKRLRGINRLAGLGLVALTECAAKSAPHLQPPVLLCAPAAGDLDDPEKLLDAVVAEASISTDRGKSRVFPGGRSAVLEALYSAMDLLQSGGTPACYLVGVDSLSDTRRARRLWDDRKLFHPGNPDGTIPGEAGVALLLTATVTKTSLASILAVGRGDDQAEDLVTGTALSRAFGQAVARAQVDPSKLAALVHDSSGTRRFAEELTLASQRPPFNRIGEAKTFAPADFTGDVGAASGPLSLAMAAFFASEAVIEGPVLLGFLGETSLRGAAVVSAAGRRGF